MPFPALCQSKTQTVTPLHIHTPHTPIHTFIHIPNPHTSIHTPYPYTYPYTHPYTNISTHIPIHTPYALSHPNTHSYPYTEVYTPIYTHFNTHILYYLPGSFRNFSRIRAQTWQPICISQTYLSPSKEDNFIAIAFCRLTFQRMHGKLVAGSASTQACRQSLAYVPLFSCTMPSLRTRRLSYLSNVPEASQFCPTGVPSPVNQLCSQMRY